jgi:hypothetical protein
VDEQVEAAISRPDEAIPLTALTTTSFLYELKGTPAEYGAGINRAIENGWLVMHDVLHRWAPICLPEKKPPFGNPFPCRWDGAVVAQSRLGRSGAAPN